MRKIIYLSFGLLLFMSCQSIKYKDVVYAKSSDHEDLKLNIFVPKNAQNKKLPVLLFVHGGNWNSGNKDQYGFFGRNFAKKDVITVIPDYTLSPKANVDQMTTEIAEVIKFVQKNISEYHGDSTKLFVTGHSAGAQLVASAVLNPKFGVPENSISGIILNDGAGIDMKNYLEKYPPTSKDDYIATWSTNPDNWYQASPINFLDKNSPPFLIYVGTKTYPSITTANEHFLKKLNEFQPEVKPIFLKKKHIPMMLQYFWPWSDRFTETIDFMKKNKK
ncbi:alpha/beta hydrolase [Kaistella flava (ex Peng et al. 2021)]|uniref:Alpha/beta hydrolase n=1 Tax=Kaistella flava (ex Peng et al. 2021) TaxID=2038776 RepID=A0A7M2Y5B9_9FLAO|nr:alpha/beta hydrolase [Kaistella flava (ex Peng et al. 2021)]QOW09049.1 alpha/beta hydrolase [Kaistella flava (ex Peng et al. 2021)]